MPEPAVPDSFHKYKLKIKNWIKKELDLVNIVKIHANKQKR